MIIVMDASAGFESLTDSSTASTIRRILEKAELVMAPDIYWAEVANACWKAVQQGVISLDDACRGLRFSTQILDSVVPSSGLLLEALTQASATAHPVYDILYLTLARREAAQLLSLDKQLRALAKRLGVRTVPL